MGQIEALCECSSTNARGKIIEDLQKLVPRQSAQIARLTVRVAELKLALAKATKDASTSSKLPSSDITKLKTAKKPGRHSKPKRGGQPRQQQHLRENLPPERVDETWDYGIADEDDRPTRTDAVVCQLDCCLLE